MEKSQEKEASFFLQRIIKKQNLLHDFIEIEISFSLYNVCNSWWNMKICYFNFIFEIPNFVKTIPRAVSPKFRLNNALSPPHCSTQHCNIPFNPVRNRFWEWVELRSKPGTLLRKIKPHRTVKLYHFRFRACGVRVMRFSLPHTTRARGKKLARNCNGITMSAHDTSCLHGRERPTGQWFSSRGLGGKNGRMGGKLRRGKQLLFRARFVCVRGSLLSLEVLTVKIIYLFLDEKVFLMQSFSLCSGNVSQLSSSYTGESTAMWEFVSATKLELDEDRVHSSLAIFRESTAGQGWQPSLCGCLMDAKLAA